MSYLPFATFVTVAGDGQDLRSTFTSLLAQDDTRWQWSLISAPGASVVTTALITELAELEPRIALPPAQDGRTAGQSAAAAATGEYLCWLGAGDTIDRSTVRTLRNALGQAAWAYTDEGVADDKGWIVSTWLKPAFSPELLLSQPYACRLAALPRETIERLGGLRAEAGTAAWYDLVLRVQLELGDPFHINGPFYRRPFDEESPWAAPYIDDDATDRCAVVLEYCRTAGIQVREVTPVVVNGIELGQRVHRIPPTGRVSVIIPTRGSASVVHGFERCHLVDLVAGLWKPDRHPDLELVLVCDADTPQEVLREVDRICSGEWTKVDFDGPFNFSRKCNQGAAAANGEYLCFLNDDTEIVSPDWLAELTSLLVDPGVGIVGSKLLFANGTLQHAGLFNDLGVPSHVMYEDEADSLDLAGLAQLTGERSAVTGACMAMRRADFLDLGGFSEVFPLNYNDVDLCFKAGAAGFRVLFTPHSLLNHFESQSREVTVTETEILNLQRRWRPLLEEDPYVNELRRKFQQDKRPVL